MSKDEKSSKIKEKSYKIQIENSTNKYNKKENI